MTGFLGTIKLGRGTTKQIPAVSSKTPICYVCCLPNFAIAASFLDPCVLVDCFLKLNINAVILWDNIHILYRYKINYHDHISTGSSWTRASTWQFFYKYTLYHAILTGIGDFFFLHRLLLAGIFCSLGRNTTWAMELFAIHGKRISCTLGLLKLRFDGPKIWFKRQFCEHDPKKIVKWPPNMG